MDSDSINISLESDNRGNPQLQTDENIGQLSLDVFETGNSIFIVAPVAGVNEKTINIALTEDLLTIRGERSRPVFLPENPKYFVEECYWGAFSRSLLLPSAVNSADISAKIDRDIIIIEIPKARKVSSKNISLEPK